MRNIDLLIIIRIIKILVTPWDKQEAFKYGIIDNHGNVLRKMRTLRTLNEKNAYDLLHRFVFNLKRLIELVPGGKSKIGTFAAATLLLLKENEYDEMLETNLQFELECVLNEDEGVGGVGGGGMSMGGAPVSANIANNASSGLLSLDTFWKPKRKKRFRE